MKTLLKLALVLPLAVPFAAAQNAPATPSVQDKTTLQGKATIQQKSAATLRQSARVDDSAEAAPQVPPQVRFVAFQSNLRNEDEKPAPAYTAGNSLGNELGGAVSRSIQVHRFHAYVKKTCRQNGPGTSWVWLFSNGQTVEGTCD